MFDLLLRVTSPLPGALQHKRLRNPLAGSGLSFGIRSERHPWHDIFRVTWKVARTWQD
jgi:hypothetical protein